ncbi:hypothetical protein ACHAXR_005535 [Thalassiosira sp. AJA248-18]
MTIRQWRDSSRRGHGSLYQMPLESLDSITNGTDWLDSQQQSARPFFGEDTTTTSDRSEIETLFEQELFEGYIAHESLLDSVDSQPNLTEEPELITALAGTDVALPTEEHTPSMPILSDVWKARLLLLLSAALYGTNFTMVKSLDESMSVGLASTLRFGFAAVAMLPWLFAPIHEDLKVLAKKRRNDNHNADMNVGQKGNILVQCFGEEPTRLSAGLAGMEIGMYNAIGYIAQAEGLKTTTASKSAFICSLAVVTVPILDYIWGKPLLRRQIVGACLAAFGVWALELGGQESGAISDGDIMSLVQPLMFGLGFWRMEAAVEKYPTEAGKLAAAQLLMVFIISLSYLLGSSAGDSSLLSDASNALPTASEIMTWLHDPYIVGMLFWTGIVTTAFTIWMETLALKTLSAAETTLIFSTEPLFGTAFAAVVANEGLGIDAAIGAAFIILGCVVSGMDVGRFFMSDHD